jgi:hypothetical protein
MTEPSRIAQFKASPPGTCGAHFVGVRQRAYKRAKFLKSRPLMKG